MCCAATALAAPRGVIAQRSFDSTLAKAMADEMRDTGAPGASIAIVRDGRIVYKQGFGITSVEGGQPITPATLFRIGSITKPLTAVAALQLRDAGRLDFNAPIARIAPELHRSLASVTLEQLLTHTAGFGQEGSGNGSHDDSALAARVRRWGPEQLIGPPNDIYSYSSPGYWLTGYLLERATGELYADVMTKHVFEPLGMQRSTLRPLVALTYPLALDHRVGSDRVARVLRPYADDASTWPGGSVFSSAEELARFAIALLDSGRIDGRQALARSTAAGMRTSHTRQADGDCSYTYGLSLCTHGKAERLSHYGFRSGTGAVFTLLPAERAAIIILSNRNGGIFGRTEQVAFRLLVGDETSSADGDGASASTSRALPGPDRFLGTFVNGRDSLRVMLRDSKLRFRYGADEQPMRVVADSAVSIVDESGAEMQRFLLKRGRHSGSLYLHDGISAYRRVVR
ncbi:MAG TPA: serine hydrolase domain-containing protein [Gemmatimonadaceae bacterium]|nr:serine hydrolase domain-containing protein [Gemmatimonadaceae bacterium]